MHGSVIQCSKPQHKGCNCQYDQAAYSSGDDRHLQHPGSVTLRLLQIALSHNISQQYATCTGNGKAEHRTDIAHYDDQ